MIVMKFGGTSLGSAAGLRAAARIVDERRPQAPLVVTSAMAGVTDSLYLAADAAAAGRAAEALSVAREIEERHLAVARDIGVEHARPEGLPEESPTVGAYLRSRMADCRDRLRGVALVGELTERTRDAIAATGELYSSALLAAAIPARWRDVRDVMVTDASFGAARPRKSPLRERARERLLPLIAPGHPLVTQGFIGRTDDGATTTLGRGGSDWSASLLGAALAADEIEIWTDVDGMLTADPRLISDARLLPEVSFEEASELAYFGAKVLHSATIRPALDRGIPVRIRNTFRLEGPGTLVRHAGSEPGVRAVALRPDVTVVRVTNPRLRAGGGYGAKVFEAFDRHGVPIGLMATSDASLSITVTGAARLDPVVAELRRVADVEVRGGHAIAAVVGTELRRVQGLTVRLFGAIEGIDVAMISTGASERSISLVVPQAQAVGCLRALHASLIAIGVPAPRSAAALPTRLRRPSERIELRSEV